ncbi:hypothetical protein BC829DRAFT_439090 [Chytridium lagenaria]|nr:hypothetical protein BC829DRAFT_439090 [Chytridium lagenaria]
MRVETKVIIERDPVTGAPRVKVIFRHMPDAERFFATVNGSMFLGSKVQLTFKDPNMNFSNTSGAKTIVIKHIPLGVTSLEFYEAVRNYGRIISCKVMMDRSGAESYALLQFENQDHADRCLQEMNGSIFRGSAIALTWQFPKNSPYQYPTHKNAAPADITSMSPPPTIHPSSTDTVLVAAAAGWEHPSCILRLPGRLPRTTARQPRPGLANSNPSSPISPQAPNSATGWHANAPAWNSAQQQSFDYSNVALDSRNLYVKNLEDHVDNLELFNLFRAYGRIVSARVMRDDSTGRSKGFGFVSFETEQMAQRALMELNGRRYGSKNIVVNIAEPRGYREKKLMAIHSNKPATMA